MLDEHGLNPQNAQRLAAAMDAPGAKPLLLHGETGDRVGALLALRAYFVDHASSEAALALGQGAGMTPPTRKLIEKQLQAAGGAN